MLILAVSQNLQLLNRQLSGMYRRTNNLSLNQPLPAASSPLATAATTDSATEDAGPVASTSAIPAQDMAAVAEEVQAPTVPAVTKRKLRSTSTRDPSTPKRVKSGAPPTASSSSSADKHAPPTTRLADLGGVDSCVEKMLELVALPLTHPEVYLHTGVRPPRGVLLVGPPGCGKTMLAGAIAGVRRFCMTFDEIVR